MEIDVSPMKKAACEFRKRPLKVEAAGGKILPKTCRSKALQQRHLRIQAFRSPGPKITKNQTRFQTDQTRTTVRGCILNPHFM